MILSSYNQKCWTSTILKTFATAPMRSLEQIQERQVKTHNHVFSSNWNYSSPQGCAKINDNDTYDPSGCDIWCRSGTLRVGAAYGLAKLNIVMSAPHFLFGQPDLPYEVRDKKGKREGFTKISHINMLGLDRNQSNGGQAYDLLEDWEEDWGGHWRCQEDPGNSWPTVVNHFKFNFSFSKPLWHL